MSVGESLGSHSLHSFAEFLQQHIDSPEASSCLTSKRKPLKPLNILKPFSLKFMAAEKSVRKGGRQRRGGTSKDLLDDLALLGKSLAAARVLALSVARVAPALLLYVSCSAGPRAAHRPKTRAAARLFPSSYI